MFPAKLVLGIGMAKCFLGLVLVTFGALALWEEAAMSYLGSGTIIIYNYYNYVLILTSLLSFFKVVQVI